MAIAERYFIRRVLSYDQRHRGRGRFNTQVITVMLR